MFLAQSTSAGRTLSETFTHAPGEVAPPLLRPEVTLGLLLAAVVVSWAVNRLAQYPGVRNWRPWFFLGHVLLWGFVTFDLVLAVSWAATEYWLYLSLLIFVVLLLSGAGWLRSVAAGLALAFERRFEVGDPVQHEDVEGELISFGVRSMSVRDEEGSVHEIPNEKFLTDRVSNLRGGGDAACEISIAVPSKVSRDRALEFGREAALLTPLASPRHEPQVFLEVDESSESGLDLRIRGYAFDPGYREHYRSDVISRVHDMLRNENAIQE